MVVDHKTDRVADDLELAGKLAAYRLQLAAYALAVERATGEAVVDARLVFCARGRRQGRGRARAPRRDGRGRGAGRPDGHDRAAGPSGRRPDDDASAGQAQLFDDAGYERLGGDESV